MNITKSNFEDAFEAMCEAIRRSHFIAVDAEFTGAHQVAHVMMSHQLSSIVDRGSWIVGHCKQYYRLTAAFVAFSSPR